MTRTLEPALRVKLAGPGIRDGRLAVADFVHLGRNLQAAVERIALVLRGESRSLRPGRRPADVAELCRLDVVGFGPGSAILELDLSEGERPFAEWDLGQAALDHLVEGLRCFAEAPGLPRGWDSGVLIAWRELGSLFERGIEQVEVERRGMRIPSVAVFTRASRERIIQQIRAPVQNLVTVEGRLLMADFDDTRRRCRVHPLFGAPVICSFQDHQREAVLELLTRYVRVAGQAEVDEQGRVRVLKIADIEPVDVPGDLEAYAFWEHRSAEELADIQGVEPIAHVQELTANLWDSDEDLKVFLAEVYRARTAGVA
jgi:hypothetical protein